MCCSFIFRIYYYNNKFVTKRKLTENSTKETNSLNSNRVSIEDIIECLLALLSLVLHESHTDWYPQTLRPNKILLLPVINNPSTTMPLASRNLKKKKKTIFTCNASKAATW